MAPQKLTEYEKRRLENIKRNSEKLAALNIQSKISQLAESIKRPRAETKSYKVTREKKKKKDTPTVLRRSLRTKGEAPDPSTACGLKDDFDESKSSMSSKYPILGSESPISKRANENGPISMRDVYRTADVSDRKLIEALLDCSRKSGSSVNNEVSRDKIKKEENDIVKKEEDDVVKKEESDIVKKEEDDVVKKEENYVIKKEENDVIEKEENEGSGSLKAGKKKVWGSIDVGELKLVPENIARVVSGRIMNVKFFPTTYARIVVAGNKFGDISFWNVDADDDDGDGIYIYHPHPAPISGIVSSPFSLSKMFTSCYDGFLRLMDTEKELFDLVYTSDESIFSMSQSPDAINSLYLAEGQGDLSVWDARTGKCSSSWSLHQNRINTIDFNSQNTNIMATSSTDGTACIWDLRYGATCLKTIKHERAVHSAYFSPSGKFLATTSADDMVGLFHGDTYKNMTMVYHNNQTGRWVSSFRGIWGWDDSYVFIGNMRRGVDVISTTGKDIIATLVSEHMSAIPCRFDTHPYEIGTLAGATSGGQVYIWRSGFYMKDDKKI